MEVNRNCPVCGKEIGPHRRRFCSTECNIKNHHEKRRRIHPCPECGKRVYIRRVYCSDECKNKFHNRRRNQRFRNRGVNFYIDPNCDDGMCSKCKQLEYCNSVVKLGIRLPCQPESEPDIVVHSFDVIGEFDGISLVTVRCAER